MPKHKDRLSQEVLTYEFIYEYYITRHLALAKIAKIARCRIDTVKSRIAELGLSRTNKHNRAKDTYAILYDKVKLVEELGITLLEPYKGQEADITMRCHCGNVFKSKVKYFLRKHKPNTSCGCQKRSRKGSSNVRWTGYQSISGSYYKSVCFRAKRKNIEFSITIEDVWETYLKQGRKCCLTNMPVVFAGAYKQNGTASIDRIDSSKGYTKTNIQIVHKDINKMKLAHSQDYFIQMCCLVAKQHMIPTIA